MLAVYSLGAGVLSLTGGGGPYPDGAPDAASHLSNVFCRVGLTDQEIVSQGTCQAHVQICYTGHMLRAAVVFRQQRLLQRHCWSLGCSKNRPLWPSTSRSICTE